MPINNDIEFRGEIDRMLDPDKQPVDKKADGEADEEFVYKWTVVSNDPQKQPLADILGVAVNKLFRDPDFTKRFETAFVENLFRI